MATNRRGGVHELDLLAQDLYELLQGDVEYLQASLAGPTPVGTRKVSPRDFAKRVFEMTHEEVAAALAQASPQTPLAAMALERLGAHGLALLPYLQPEPTSPAGVMQAPAGEEIF